jgi:ABC-type glycerol-3-phosphate transport system permease component
MVNTRRWIAVVEHLGIYLFIAIFSYPIFWLFMAAVVGFNDMVAYDWPLIPPTISFKSFIRFFQHTNAIDWLWNSTIVAVVSTLVSVLVAIPAGYALARLPFWGRETMGRLLLVTYIVPPVLLVVPMFLVMANFKLLNTLSGLILTHITICLPFCIWILRGYFSSLPRDIEDAGRIDGLSLFGVIWRVVVPISGPGVGAAAAFTFIISWQEFLFAFTLMSKQTMKTLPVGIAGFPSNVVDQTLWANMMSSSVIATIPVFIVFLALQKFFVQGLTAGAVKG